VIHRFPQPPLPAGGRWAPPPLTELAAEDREMVTANREASIAKAEAEIARIEAALDSPVYRRDPSDENPDLTAEGVAVMGVIYANSGPQTAPPPSPMSTATPRG
jgi:hypothetical protein